MLRGYLKSHFERARPGFATRSALEFCFKNYVRKFKKFKKIKTMSLHVISAKSMFLLLHISFNDMFYTVWLRA